MRSLGVGANQANGALSNLRHSQQPPRANTDRPDSCFHTAYGIAKRENLDESADTILISQASVEIASGMPLAARSTLSHVKDEDTNNPDFALLSTTLGDTSAAERLLAQYSGTGEPWDANQICVCAPASRCNCHANRKSPSTQSPHWSLPSPYELAGGLIAFAQRGEAYRLASQEQNAAAEYKNILSHPGLNPLSPLLPLAHLSLARAEADAGDVLRQSSKSRSSSLSGRTPTRTCPSWLPREESTRR